MVVIATVLPGKDSGEDSRDNSWKAKFVGVNTLFTVEGVLKGKVLGGKLTVLHYRLEAGHSIESGPTLVSFRTRKIDLTTKGAKVQLGRPSYLLFLKKRKDGRYEPVSGTVDPSLSVREVFRPLPERLGRRKD